MDDLRADEKESMTGNCKVVLKGALKVVQMERRKVVKLADVMGEKMAALLVDW